MTAYVTAYVTLCTSDGQCDVKGAGQWGLPQVGDHGEQGRH